MTEETKTEAKAAQGQFGVQRVFVRDMSFESPLNLTERNEAKPKIDQEINTKVNKLNDTLYEVVLQLTVTVKLGDTEEAKVAVIAEVHQAGLFQIKDIPEQHLQRL